MAEEEKLDLRFDGPKGAEFYLQAAQTAVGLHDMETARLLLERALALSGGKKAIKKRLALHHLGCVIDQMLSPSSD